MNKEEWQKGEESILTSLQRLELHNEWLKKIHKELKKEIDSTKIKEDDTPVTGFIE